MMTGQTKMCLIRPFYFSDAIFHMFRFGILNCCCFFSSSLPFFIHGLRIWTENTKNYSIIYQVAAEQKRGSFRSIYFSIDDRQILCLSTVHCNIHDSGLGTISNRSNGTSFHFGYASIICMSMGPIENHHLRVVANIKWICFHYSRRCIFYFIAIPTTFVYFEEEAKT